MTTEQEKELLPPQLVLDLWTSKRPGIQPVLWELLNDVYEDSKEWECAIYKMMANVGDPLYIALKAIGTEQSAQLTARELTTEEVTFLTTGEIPDEEFST